ncbi:MAG: hypothetical protein ACLFPL_02405 [Candidatus Nanoarchaeia archaeon]
MGIFNFFEKDKSSTQFTFVEAQALQVLKKFKQSVNSFMSSQFVANQDDPLELNKQIISTQAMLKDLKQKLTSLGFKDAPYLSLPLITFSSNNINTQAKILNQNLNHLSEQLQLMITDIEAHPRSVGIDKTKSVPQTANENRAPSVKEGSKKTAS